jgi:hypothetical protein
VERKTTYFDKPGKANTDAALDAAVERLKENDLTQVVVASYSGDTAFKLVEKLKAANVDVKIVIVTVHAGTSHKESFNQVPENVEKIKALGFEAASVRAGHVLSGVERGMFSRYQGTLPVLVLADTLRLFCEGVKVCAETVMMAADAGEIDMKEDVLAIAGSGGGADTAMVVKPAFSKAIFDLSLKEIICKPVTEGLKHKAG